MCYREVHCVKHSCGHDSPTSEHRVDCSSDKCRYSSLHDPACADCPTTCKQWLRPAKTIVKSQSAAPCSGCN